MKMEETRSTIRVCQLWDEYLPIFTGAAVRHDQFSVCLRELDVLIEVITVQWPGTMPHETINDIPVFRVPAGRQTNRNFRDIFNGWMLCKAIWARRSEFDMLYSLSTNEFHLPALLLAHFLGKPVIIEFNLMRDPGISLPARVLSLLAYFFYRYFTAFILISGPLMETAIRRKLPVDKCHLIPVGVYTDEFAPLPQDAREALREQLGLKPQTKYLLFVGSLIRRKGVDVLVEMMSLLAETRVDIELILIGQHDFSPGHSGYSFAESTKAQIQAYGLNQYVHLIGRLHPYQVLPWMQASDIFVFPSRREGLGRVILEAMSVSLPCVCSSMDGVAYDMIKPEVNGIVAESIDPHIFAGQILRLVDDPELRQFLGTHARQTVISGFDERKIAFLYRKLFEDIGKTRQHE